MVVCTWLSLLTSWDGNLAHTINVSRWNGVAISGETCSGFMLNAYTPLLTTAFPWCSSAGTKLLLPTLQ